MSRRAHAIAGTMAAVVVGAMVTLPGSTASARTTDQSYWVPVDGHVVVQGHGFGHGHGMSQYGAQGAALKGLGYKEIVDFYYPGTSWSKVRGKVRVLITADSGSDVLVGPRDGLSVRDLSDGTTYELPTPEGVTRWRLVPAGDATAVAYLTDRWHRFRPEGRKKRVFSGDAEFFAPGPITLWTPSGPRSYRGALRAASPTPDSTDRDTVNVLTMDQYVMGVVPYEMPASWSTEAVKSQAIAARTYASWSRAQAPKRYYQICDTTACQVYGGATAEDSRSNAAVRATRAQILTYDGKPAFTQFSSSNGGWMAAGAVPYLAAKEDPYDGWAGNPVHDWTITVDASRFENNYPSLGNLRRIQVVQRDGHGDWQGRVEKVVLDGSRGDVTISGDEFRWAFGLRSDWFTIKPTPIIERWAVLGGEESPLGSVRTSEYAVTNGSAQVFAHGRIYYSKGTGAHELTGGILATYRGLGGPSSDLGLPTTGVQHLDGGGAWARFHDGTIHNGPETPATALTGLIASRYLRFGSTESRLGWPTRTNFATPYGQRANFQGGFIKYDKSRDRTYIRFFAN